MAWQTPKTDWSQADGVRDVDFNRIEGNILELYKGTNMSSKTIYVSTTGNDVAGLGTSASPYATIEKALSTIPKNLNDKNITINIASGTYYEPIVIENYFGGLIILTSDGTINVEGVEVSNAVVNSDIYNLEVGSSGVYISYGAVFRHDNNVKLYGVGLTATHGATAIIGTLNAVYATTAARAQNSARVYLSYLEGYSDVSMHASTGGIIAYNNNAMSGTISTASGGRILGGSGTTLASASVE